MYSSDWALMRWLSLICIGGRASLGPEDTESSRRERLTLVPHLISSHLRPTSRVISLGQAAHGEDLACGRGNCTGAMGYLSRSVFRDRLARIREALREADLAALAVLTPENFLYVSGYFRDVQPWER